MNWIICFIIAIVIFAASIVYAISSSVSRKVNRTANPLHVLFVGAFVGVFVLLIPVSVCILSRDAWIIAKIPLFDLANTLQIFTINIDSSSILESISQNAGTFAPVYSAFTLLLFVVSPMLTFGFIISFFQNALTKLRLKFHFRRELYVFSQLNENSLSLAKDINRNHPRAMIVMCGIDLEDGNSTHLVESARGFKALLIKDDILDLNLNKRRKKSKIALFAISDDEAKNVSISLQIAKKYGDRKNTRLYVFSPKAEGEVFLTGLNCSELVVRRVDKLRSLVYHLLDKEGYSLFEKATPNGSTKKITCAIVGLGWFGTEMLKALSWYCQMDGYTFSIDAFDAQTNAGQRIASLCPELVADNSTYDIKIHSGVDVETVDFDNLLNEIDGINFVFVCLGNDELSITTAAKIRMLCERNGSHPTIKAVIKDTDKAQALAPVTNFKGQPYSIEPIGDTRSLFTEEMIIGNKLEEDALQRHLKWGDENDFWKYEYNYRSSMASALHHKARIFCEIPGADKCGEELTSEEQDIIERLEHRRWNAYMRSEGYVYSGSPDSSSRNDLAKAHHNIIDFELLSEEDKRKDSKIGTK